MYQILKHMYTHFNQTSMQYTCNSKLSYYIKNYVLSEQIELQVALTTTITHNEKHIQ